MPTLVKSDSCQNDDCGFRVAILGRNAAIKGKPSGEIAGSARGQGFFYPEN